MYHQFVPISLQSQATAFIDQLVGLSNRPIYCPYCQQNRLNTINAEKGYYRCKHCHKSFNRTVGTPYYHLTPLAWLPIILKRRLCGQGYAQIRYQLDFCTSSVVKRRVKAIEYHMAADYPALFDWYQHFIHSNKSNIPQAVQFEAQQLKQWLNDILQGKHTICPYCQSNKVNQQHENRARFRCKSCWRFFSNLKGHGLENLGYSQHWLAMIDMFTAGQTVQAISKKLKINHNTVTRARQKWLKIMQRQGLLILMEWVMGAKSRHSVM